MTPDDTTPQNPLDPLCADTVVAVDECNHDDQQRILTESQDVGEVAWFEDEREHVLEVPDMYVGSAKVAEMRGVGFSVPHDDKSLTPELYCATASPAALHLLKEVVANAVDNGFRDATQTKICVTVDQQSGVCEVFNDGKGIDPGDYDARDADAAPLSKVTVLFSKFRSGTNFQQTTTAGTAQQQDQGVSTQKAVAGGRNGFGVTLVNTFSKWFEVETLHPESKTRFKQRWVDNMRVASPPQRKKTPLKRGFVRVRFLIDFEKLGMPPIGEAGVSAQLMLAMSRVACDVAIVSGLRKTAVYWSTASLPPIEEQKNVPLWKPNLLPLTNGADYLHRLFGADVDSGPRTVIREAVKRARDGLVVLEVSACFITEEERERFADADGCLHLGFVNGIRCPLGRHRQIVDGALVKTVRDHIMRTTPKHQGALTNVQPRHVLRNLATVVSCLVADKSFTSQCKEKLDTTDLGFTWTPSKAFTGKLLACGIVELVREAARQKETAQAKRRDAPSRAKTLAMENYEPPVQKTNAELYVTEGKSAGHMVKGGLSVVGRDRTGIYMLKGKLLNVRKTGVQRSTQNKEISDLNRILRLQPDVTYTPELVKKLPFSKLVIFADQDPDGDHIAGLVINWLHYEHPSLLAASPNFVKRFATPLIKVTPKGAPKRARDDSDDGTLDFYTKNQFDRWMRDTPAASDGRYGIKYYKGLGTHTPEEARKLFRNPCLMDLQFTGVPCQEAIDDFFDAGRTGRRKTILTDDYDQHAFVDYEQKSITMERFLRDGVVHFSQYDNIRSFPGIDGLKPGQRKVLWTFLTSASKQEKKVAQVSGTIAEKTGYHHGEEALHGTIVKLAQEQIGTNNVPLLLPIGQFGSRHAKTSVHANPRYIFTRLRPLAELVFPKADFAILPHQREEGQRIEPRHLTPILPYALVNGVLGIGTGFRSEIPPHHPLDVIAACERLVDAVLRGEEVATTPLRSLVPWFDGFQGALKMEPPPQSDPPATVEAEVSPSAFTTHGIVDVNLETSVVIVKELCPTQWTDEYMADVRSKLTGCGDATAPADNKPPPKRPKGGTEGTRVGSASSPAEGPANKKTSHLVDDFFNGSSEHRVHVELKCNAAELRRLHESSKLDEALMLRRTTQMKQMHYFDASGQLRWVKDTRDLLREFAALRLGWYDQRKAHVLTECDLRMQRLSSEMIYLEARLEGKLIISKRPRLDVLRDIDRLGCKRIPPGNAGNKASDDDDNITTETVRQTTGDKEEEATTHISDPHDAELVSEDKCFDYLLKTADQDYTAEAVARKRAQHAALGAEIVELRSTSPATTWKRELRALRVAVEEYLEDKHNRRCSQGDRVTTNFSQKGGSTRKRKATPK